MRLRVIGIVIALALAWLILDLAIRPLGDREDRAASIEFVVPQDYLVLDLDESTLPAAALRLRDALETDTQVAAVFRRSGDQVQLLVDLPRDLIHERITGRNGTLIQSYWRGPVRERLAWAAEHGTLEAPGLPPPEQRNPYH